jgi:hypothetical protein
MNTFLRIAQVASMTSLFALVACAGASYRVVKKTPEGGVVALAGSRDEAHSLAEGYMKSQCPGGFDVVEEGEAVIGEDSKSATKPSLFTIGQNTATSTTQKTEWRINYKCKGAAGGDEKKTSGIRSFVVRY